MSATFEPSLIELIRKDYWEPLLQANPELIVVHENEIRLSLSTNEEFSFNDFLTDLRYRRDMIDEWQAKNKNKPLDNEVINF